MEEGQRYFQLQEPSRNEAVAVGVTSTVIAETRNADNPRKVITIRNSSTGGQVITVHIGQGTAVAAAGLPLNPNEAITDSTESGYLCHQGTITAISDLANGQLSIMER